MKKFVIEWDSFCDEFIGKLITEWSSLKENAFYVI